LSLQVVFIYSALMKS